MPGRGKASRGRGSGASASSASVTRKRKAEVQAEKDKEPENEHEGGDNEGDEGQEDEKEVTFNQWKTPGESDWDDTPPTSLSTPDQLAVVVPLGTKQKNMGRGFCQHGQFSP